MDSPPDLGPRVWVITGDLLDLYYTLLAANGHAIYFR